MRIAVGSDERSPLTDAVLRELERREMEIEVYGALNPSGAGKPVAPGG